ncbi:protein AGENET DOMAIN (AGD)-CONTAINING P1-like [Humulus lupulus]|uniref:protein AGENET DOMAIN (AGD)-CONTAINING P1-like n=1 Tax=Humulus lupulus TaxID=3486 RepID=UPI002B40E404|nr:protein AGENET DOMAIN (AGD)-CONTAINING P1-like [Humulus lupulus]XP_062104407.1 protein AGENET DOMAIN (AGD)-CONTAINING P1-like [Humulus lupulus]
MAPSLPLNEVVFKVGDDVDVFYWNGWCRGMVMRVLEEKSRYVVRFHNSGREVLCPLYSLRLHMERNDGAWVPPLLQQRMSSPTNLEAKERTTTTTTTTHNEFNTSSSIRSKEPLQLLGVKERTMKVVKTADDHNKNKNKRTKIKIVFRKKPIMEAEAIFKNGTMVEASSDEKGYEGAWYKAKIIEAVGSDKFLVEYQDLVTEDDNTQLLRENAERRHLRPEPPLVPTVSHFKLLEKVDAWYNDGWWEGEISKVLPAGAHYVLYFKHTNEEMTFALSDLRPHQDWINGKWYASTTNTTMKTDI